MLSMVCLTVWFAALFGVYRVEALLQSVASAMQHCSGTMHSQCTGPGVCIVCLQASITTSLSATYVVSGPALLIC